MAYTIYRVFRINACLINVHKVNGENGLMIDWLVMRVIMGHKYNRERG